MPPRAEIVVDLAAIRHNVRLLREVVGPGVAMMTVVKADGYGHGMVPVARAAREAGADWLGVATIDEALALRAAGDTGPLLCWLGGAGRGLRRRDRRGRRRDGVLHDRGRRDRRRRRRAGPRGCSSRSTPACPAAARPRRLAGRRRGSPRRELERAASRSPASGRTSPARRPRPPRQRRPGAGLRRGPRRRGRRPGWTRGCATWPTPPAALTAARVPLRPGAVRARVLRLSPGAGPPHRETSGWCRP